MTSDAPVGLERRMLEREWPLLIGVTPNTRGVSPGRESRLFRFKPAVRVVTIAALHRPFQNLVGKRLVVVGLWFSMATHTELTFTHLQQCDGGVSRLLGISLRDMCNRASQVGSGYERV